MPPLAVVAEHLQKLAIGAACGAALLFVVSFFVGGTDHPCLGPVQPGPLRYLARDADGWDLASHICCHNTVGGSLDPLFRAPPAVTLLVPSSAVPRLLPPRCFADALPSRSNLPSRRATLRTTASSPNSRRRAPRSFTTRCVAFRYLRPRSGARSPTGTMRVAGTGGRRSGRRRSSTRTSSSTPEARWRASAVLVSGSSGHDSRMLLSASVLLLLPDRPRPQPARLQRRSLLHRLGLHRGEGGQGEQHHGPRGYRGVGKRPAHLADDGDGRACRRQLCFERAGSAQGRPCGRRGQAAGAVEGSGWGRVPRRARSQ